MSRKTTPNKNNTEPRKTTPANEEIPCLWPGCQRIFVSSKNLEKHFKGHTEGVHECIYCKRQFQQKIALKYHIRIHTGEKPHTCSDCPKSFSTHGNLQSHTRIHTGEKPYDCGICRKSFAVKSVLDSHMRTHTGEKPYNCKLCGKTFARSYTLAVHQRIHNGDRPYQCTTCSKSFSKLWNLQVHMTVHTRERPFNCKICLESFSRKDNMQVHMRKHADKMPRARFSSGGGEYIISNNRNQRGRKADKLLEENKPNHGEQLAKTMHKEANGRHNEGVSMGGATKRRMQTNYKKNNVEISSLTCKVCSLFFASLENLCRHYSLQHNLPKVLLHR